MAEAQNAAYGEGESEPNVNIPHQSGKRDRRRPTNPPFHMDSCGSDPATQEACGVDQFEQHLRCVLGLPLGDCNLRAWE